MSLWEEINNESNNDLVAKSTINFTNENERYKLLEDLVMYIKKDKEKYKIKRLLMENEILYEDVNVTFIRHLKNYFLVKKLPKRKIHKNPFLIDPLKGLSLVSDLIQTKTNFKNIDKAYDNFCNLITNDFMEFSKIEDLPNEAEMYDKIKQLQERIEISIRFPNLVNKTIIGVGGGFSSGKSSFVNAILESDVNILPTDTMPTTSIPTYVYKGKNDLNIFCNNIFGEFIPIDDQALLAISHEFKRTYDINLSPVLKKIVVETAFMKFDKVALMDTPGYTKSELKTKSDNTDETISKTYLTNTDSLIWIIDIEQGTIPKTDIDFLSTMNYKKPILIVFSKADKKPHSEIIEIIKTTKEILETKNLLISEVIAYSAKEKKEYTEQNMIQSFINSYNVTNKFKLFSDEMDEIMKVYEEHSNNSISEIKKSLSVLNKLDTLAYKTFEDDENFDDFVLLHLSYKNKLTEKKSIARDFNVLRKKFNKTILSIDKYFIKR